MTSVADIIGAEAAAGQPEAVRRQASHLRDLADTTEAIRRQLGDLTPTRWTGVAATAFHSNRDRDLPGELANLGVSLDRGAAALSTWAHELDDLQARAREIAARKDQAMRAEQAARAQAATARREVQRAVRHHAASFGDPVASAKTASKLGAAKGASHRADSAANDASRSLATVNGQAQALRAELDVKANHRARELGDASGPPNLMAMLAGLTGAGLVAGLGVLGSRRWFKHLGTGGGREGRTLLRALLDDRNIQTAFNYIDRGFDAGKRLVGTTIGALQKAPKALQGTVWKAVTIADRHAGGLFRAAPKILGPVGAAYGAFQTYSNVERRFSKGDYGGGVVSGIGTAITIHPVLALGDFVTGGFLGADKGVVSGTYGFLADSVTDADSATQRAHNGDYGPVMWGVERIGTATSEPLYIAMESYHLTYDVLTGDSTAVDRALDGQYGDGVRRISEVGNDLGGAIYDTTSAAAKGLDTTLQATGQAWNSGVDSVRGFMRF